MRTVEPIDDLARVIGADDLGGLDELLQGLDATLQEGLLVAGRLVVGVLAQVAKLACVLDPHDHLGPFDAGELVELRVQCRETRGGDVCRRRQRFG